jgi:hypothetical protein
MSQIKSPPPQPALCRRKPGGSKSRGASQRNVALRLFASRLSSPFASSTLSYPQRLSKQTNSRHDAFDLAVLKSAGHDGPLLYPGPLCGGESGSTGPEGGIGRMPMPFRQHRDVLSKSPAAAHGLAAHGGAASAKRGGLLFWLLFSWPLYGPGTWVTHVPGHG